MWFVLANMDNTFCGIALPVVMLANVHLDMGVSCGTSSCMWTLNFVNLQFGALFGETF